jgi:hypothetical protein
MNEWIIIYYYVKVKKNGGKMIHVSWKAIVFEGGVVELIHHLPLLNFFKFFFKQEVQIRYEKCWTLSWILVNHINIEILSLKPCFQCLESVLLCFLFSFLACLTTVWKHSLVWFIRYSKISSLKTWLFKFIEDLMHLVYNIDYVY